MFEALTGGTSQFLTGVVLIIDIRIALYPSPFLSLYYYDSSTPNHQFLAQSAILETYPLQLLSDTC